MIHSTGFNSGLSFESGISLINSTDSYFPLIYPCLSGASGCVMGFERIIWLLGIRVWPSLDCAALKFDIAWSLVISKGMNSRGVVGPGNCALSW
jgi:hypothetical protein